MIRAIDVSFKTSSGDAGNFFGRGWGLAKRRQVALPHLASANGPDSLVQPSPGEV